MACILDKKNITAVSNQLKLNKFNVVFTHGSFDLFHIGHAEFLRQSKRKGDYLIVGVEDDERIAQYKGADRPVIPREQRTEVLLGRTDIDFILPITGKQVNTDYYFDLYENLKPSTVTFGRDFHYEGQYREKRVKSMNIEWEKIIHKYDGLQSTTNIINRLKK